MAGGFPRFSSPANDEEEAEVDAIVSQAIDLCALQHIAKLNSAHLHEDSSALPTDLEARFRKLKSFPPDAARTKPRCLLHHRKGEKEHEPTATPPNPSFDPPPPNKEEDQRPQQEERHEKPEVFREAEITCATQPEGEKVVETKPGSGLGCSKREPSPSPSPPKQACCFVFSPKKYPAVSSKKEKEKKKEKKGKEGGVGGGWEMDDEYWRVNNEMLSDLRSFSLKEQRRNLKRVVKEQEKASREAEKLVEWVKQTSARMEVGAFDGLPSSDDDDDDDDDHDGMLK